MKAGKTSTVIRAVFALAILIYGGIMLALGENSVLDKLFTYFTFFVLVFSELLCTKTYNLCDGEKKARIAVHAVASAIIVVVGVVFVCLGIASTAGRNSVWRYIPLIVFALDAATTPVIETVFKRKNGQ